MDGLNISDSGSQIFLNQVPPQNITVLPSTSIMTTLKCSTLGPSIQLQIIRLFFPPVIQKYIFITIGSHNKLSKYILNYTTIQRLDENCMKIVHI